MPNLSQRLYWISVASWTLFMIIAALSTGGWLMALLALSLGGLWVISYLRTIAWLPSPLLASGIALAALGLLQGFDPIWVVLSALACLAAWDLAGFTCYLSLTEDEAVTARLERQHLRLLFGILGIAFLLSIVVVLVQLRLTLSLAILIALLGIYTLSKVFAHYRKDNP